MNKKCTSCDGCIRLERNTKCGDCVDFSNYETQKNYNDPVNPNHYNGNVSISCIDAMEVTFGVEWTTHFCLINAFKYMWRYKDKNGEEDLKKTRWYLDYVERQLDSGLILSSDDTEGTMYLRLNGMYTSIIGNLLSTEE